MIAQKTRRTLELCNEHLEKLFHAIQTGDVKVTYDIEHKLTFEEECVACSYSFRAKGKTREVLNTFLQQEGFMVSTPYKASIAREISFWLIRMIILTAIFMMTTTAMLFIKSVLFESRTMTLGAFGLAGSLLVALAIFIVIEQWVLE